MCWKMFLEGKRNDTLCKMTSKNLYYYAVSLISPSLLKRSLSREGEIGTSSIFMLSWRSYRFTNKQTIEK